MLKRESINNTSKDFAAEVIKLGSKVFPLDYMQTLLACMQCGACTGGCPSGRRTAWRVRQIFLKAQRGLKEEALSDEDLWNCTTCYTCQERCPRDVKTTDIVRVMRNIAVREGYINPKHLKVCEILIKYGHAVPVNEKIREVRKRLGLSELPPTVHSHPDALEELLKIIDQTGFKDILKTAEQQGGKSQ